MTTDQDELNGIHDKPLSPAELRAFRQILYEERQKAWAARVGWKWFLGLVTLLSALAGAVTYFVTHFRYTP